MSGIYQLLKHSPHKGPVNQSFGVVFGVSRYKWLKKQSSCQWFEMPWCSCDPILCGLGGHFKNTYELLNLRALKFSPVNKMHIFQCMGKIFCVEFQRVPLKFHTKYLTHTLKDTFLWNVEILRALRVKSSYAFLKHPQLERFGEKHLRSNNLFSKKTHLICLHQNHRCSFNIKWSCANIESTFQS